MFGPFIIIAAKAKVWILSDANKPLNGICNSIAITCFTHAGLTRYFSESKHSFLCASMFRIISFSRGGSRILDLVGLREQNGA